MTTSIDYSELLRMLYLSVAEALEAQVGILCPIGMGAQEDS